MKISIIIPAYNCENYICRAVDSALSQEGAELQIIVVNDGSTDGTRALLEGYGDRICLINEENGGASAARNRGLKEIDGDYTMFLDADDYYADNTVKFLTKKIEETGADIIKFKYRLVYPDGSRRDASNQLKDCGFFEKNCFKKKIYPHFINGIRLNSMCCGIYRSSLIKGREFRTDMRVAEDAVFSLGVFTDAQSVYIADEVLYNYYQTGSGLTGSGVSVKTKYECNNIFASETVKYLKSWGMDTPFTRFRVRMRPVLLTVDKIKRIIKSKF
ncbi:MAG: glycosyltransferase family 2 protein [Clostridia bacterium]|nr:glycosyltransferase family 2 protein [Clostridia bacterium]